MTRKIAVGTLHYCGTFNQLEELLLGALFLVGLMLFKFEFSSNHQWQLNFAVM